MSDDDGELFYFPTRGEDLGGMPGLPPPRPVVPPESPEETTMELPVIPDRVHAADHAAAVTAAEPMPVPDTFRGEGPQPPAHGAGALMVAAPLAVGLAALRGMATVVSGWHERRMAEHAEAAPLREARVKAQVGHLQQRAEHALAMRKLGDQGRQALAKSNLPSGESGGKTGGGGRGSGGGVGRGPGGGGSRGSETGSKAGPGRGPKSGSGGGKGPAGASSSAGGPGRGSGGGANGAGGKNGKNGPGGGKGSPGSSGGGGKGSGGSGGHGSGVKSPSGGKAPRSAASSPALERARGRQERAAARQTARLERRGARHAASLADRARDRELGRDRKQAAREARRAAKTERAAAKREAKAAKDAERVTFGAAVVEEARRRWKKRRKNPDPPIVSKVTKRKKGKGKKRKTSAGPGKGGPKVGPKKKPGTGTGSGKSKPGKGGGKWRLRARPWRKGRWRTRGKAKSGGRFTAGASSFGAAAAGEGPPGREDAWTSARKATGRIWDPFYVVRDDDPWSRPEPQGVTTGQLGVTTGQLGLPRAPEPHTRRPGTSAPSRATSAPGTTEENVSTVQTTTPQQGLAPRHRTEMTLDSYLSTMGRIALNAGETAEEASRVSQTMQATAKAIAEMQQDLADGHNVTDPGVMALLDTLAEAAQRMGAESHRMADHSQQAAGGALMAARAVNADYRRDQDAKTDAGLKHASAAAHHEE
jgi:hypothetical protein